MGEVNKDIVIVMMHYSIVVKGMEKRLADENYFVKAVVSETIDARIHAGKTGLFIFYLPEDITENLEETRIMMEMLDIITASRQKTIIIGEKKYQQELMETLPVLSGFTWLNRPVDMEVLFETIDKELRRRDTIQDKKRILIVDDDPAYARMVREWIGERYQVNIVTAGMQAITFLLKNKADLILLDYEMPVVDGPQVFQMLMSEEATKHIPVVFLTGVGTREGVTRVMSLKPAGYVLKSTTKEGLLDTISGVLSNKG